jgi:hypothetical protein
VEVVVPVALSSLARVDYGDRFARRTTVAATPEQWARAMFGNVPNAAETLIWRGLLGMPLYRRRSSATVAGWPIVAHTATSLLLENGSWFLTANLLVHARPDEVSLATSVQYDRPPARVLWSLLSHLHRRLVPGLLRDAEAALLRG